MGQEQRGCGSRQRGRHGRDGGSACRAFGCLALRRAAVYEVRAPAPGWNRLQFYLAAETRATTSLLNRCLMAHWRLPAPTVESRSALTDRAGQLSGIDRFSQRALLANLVRS